MNRRIAFTAGAVLLLVAVLVAIRHGPVELGWATILEAVAVEVGISSPGDVSLRERVIVWHLRLPRVLTGAFVGASLALSGALLQGLFRNPMASPGILGVSSGGALGATTAIALGLGARTIWAVPLSAFAGALAAGFAVYALATERGRTPIPTLILCGLAMNAVTGALTSLVLSLSVRDFELAGQILFWLMGGLTNRTWEHVAVVAPFFALSAVGATMFPRELNLLVSGEESALALGVDTASVKRWILGISAAAAGAAVAVAGVIGFVGLIVPHMVRLVIGPDHRSLLPACAIAGALFVVSIDLLSRLLLGGEEVRLGILTSALGGPFFLLLLLRHRSRAEVL